MPGSLNGLRVSEVTGADIEHLGLVMIPKKRGAVHGIAVLRARRHRPRQSQEQASMIRRYIIWRNNHAYDERLRRIVDKAT